MKGWLPDAIRAISAPPLRTILLRHIGTIEGLENLPRSGPLVVAPNHTSYFDHFVIEFILEALRGLPTWFLTKREAFTFLLPRLWAEAWFGIPLNREAPRPSTLRSIQAVLGRGDALCVYPEGTRGDGTRLLPFKAGAFRFALSAGAPVVPVAIFGSNNVLARGDWRFRRGAVHVVIGEPIVPDASQARRQQAQSLAAQSREALEHLLIRARRNAQRVKTDSLGRQGGRLIDQIVAENIDAKGNLSLHVRRRLEFLARLYQKHSPLEPDLLVQRARLEGFQALSAPYLRRTIHAHKVRRQAERVLALAPNHMQAHYLLGRWHIAIPRAAGGNPESARRHFRAAVEASEQGDVRALEGLAEAQLALGFRAEAEHTLRLALAEIPPAHPRSAIRTERVMKRLQAISSERRS